MLCSNAKRSQSENDPRGNKNKTRLVPASAEKLPSRIYVTTKQHCYYITITITITCHIHIHIHIHIIFSKQLTNAFHI